MITKINTSDSGKIYLIDHNDEHAHILINVPIIIQEHARHGDAVLLSTTPTNQDEHEAIKLYASSIVSINGEAFSGDKNTLLIKLGEVFTSASASMQQALEGKANLEGGNDLEGVQSILNANGEQLKLIQEAGVSEWGFRVGSDKDLLFKFLGSGKVRFTDDGTILAGGIHLFGSARLDSEYAIRDNRNNTILQQSAHTAVSNRTLTIGNATYKDIVLSSKIKVLGSIQMADDTDVASEDKVGAMRYRTGKEHVEVDGNELITNGDFASDSDWLMSTGWSISDGVASCSELSNNLAQDLGVTAGKTYRVTLEVTDYTSGTLFVDIGGSSSQTTDSLGSKVFLFTAISTGSLRFYGGSFKGSIDNVSVVEVVEKDASYADMCMQVGASTYEWTNILKTIY